MQLKGVSMQKKWFFLSLVGATIASSGTLFGATNSEADLSLSNLLAGSMLSSSQYRLKTQTLAETETVDMDEKKQCPVEVEDPCFNPCCCFLNPDSVGMLISAEGLFWSTHEEDVTTGHYTIAIAPNNYTVDIDPSWGGGFRIGLGGRIGEGWDIIGIWTYFHDSMRDTHRSNPNATTQTVVKTRLRINLNVADLEFGRSFKAAKNLCYRPILGLRAVIFDQSLRFDFSQIISMGTSTFGDHRATCDFWGLGIRAGLFANAVIGYKFGIYGLGTFSPVYSDYDIEFSSRTNNTTTTDTDTGFHKWVWNAQLGLGVDWSTYVSNDRFFIRIFAGWEYNKWFGANKFSNSIQVLHTGTLRNRAGDLSFNGLTFGGRFDF
ncbi:MAG: Lpg1974 family pore-forming outer membrane protein [Chlamydiae bacterium]|nr:Lpg1974 family pore-forming outer membrane protein [Chlamydiota bacterium]